MQHYSLLPQLSWNDIEFLQPFNYLSSPLKHFEPYLENGPRDPTALIAWIWYGTQVAQLYFPTWKYEVGAKQGQGRGEQGLNVFYPALPISIMLEWAAGGEGFPFWVPMGVLPQHVLNIYCEVSASASVLVSRVQVRKVCGCCHFMSFFLSANFRHKVKNYGLWGAFFAYFPKPLKVSAFVPANGHCFHSHLFSLFYLCRCLTCSWWDFFLNKNIRRNIALCKSKLWKQTTHQNRCSNSLCSASAQSLPIFFPHVSAKTNLEGDISQRQIYLEQNIQTAQSFVMQLQQIENVRFYLTQLKLKANKASVISTSRQVIVSQGIIFVLHRQQEDRQVIIH